MDALPAGSGKVEDIIIQEPKVKKIIRSSDLILIIRDPRNFRILTLLHQYGPSTIEDIHERFHSGSGKRVPKSESTIYRYLSNLRIHGLVQEAGKRVVEGKIYVKSLYSLSTNYFIIEEGLRGWTKSDTERQFRELFKILSHLYPNEKIIKEDLYDWHLRFNKSAAEDREKLLTSENPEILEKISIWTPYPFDEIFAFMSWESFLIKNPFAQIQYSSCFKGSTEEGPDSREIIIRPDRQKAPYKDILRNYPEFFSGISSKEGIGRFFEKPTYVPLFQIIRDGPITTSELVRKYNQIAPVKKTRKTIYRYIKQLREANLVIEMGKRVFRGKKTIQKIYGPTSRNIGSILEFDSNWETKERQWLIETIKELLEYLHPTISKIDRECFKEFRALVSHYGDEKLVQELKLQKNRPVFELLHSYSYRDYYMIMPLLYDYYFFKNIPDLYERIARCFKKQPVTIDSS
ncbi:MAG: hypothetical protein ACFFE8_02665 [Candidatus Heimdallarchaeota archaeon]